MTNKRICFSKIYLFSPWNQLRQTSDLHFLNCNLILLCIGRCSKSLVLASSQESVNCEPCVVMHWSFPKINFFFAGRMPGSLNDQWVFFHLQRLVLVPVLWTGYTGMISKAVVSFALNDIGKVCHSFFLWMKKCGFPQERSRRQARGRLLVNFYHRYWNDWRK